MIKQIIELVLALALAVLPLSPAAPETTMESETAVTTAAVRSQQDDGVMLARFENMLEKNYCFGDDFFDSRALISSASIVLKNQIQDGYIPTASVDAFLYNMYGCDTVDFAGENGFYAVTPCGFDVYEYTVNEYTYNGDGTITTLCDVVINPDADAQHMSATATFFADGSSAFGYNLISCELY